MTEDTGTLRRATSRDIEALLSLLRDPAIAPGALKGLPAGSDLGELAHWLADARNVALVRADAAGVVLFDFAEPTVYEVHTLALPSVRGRSYLASVEQALRMMFLQSDAMQLYTKVPASNRGALGLVRLIEGVHEFDCSWQGEPCGHWKLDFYDWLNGRGGRSCEARGKWFHERLEEQFAAQGRTHETHDDCAAHDRAVGATVELILSGLLAKAIVLYNRWARRTGYHALEVVVQSPLVLSTGDALLQVDFANEDFLLLETTPAALARGAL